jgi:hypothetical protein
MSRSSIPNRLAPCLLAALALPAAAPAQEAPKFLTQVGIATGTVAPNGVGFVSLSGTNRSPAGNTDGSLALGFGIGSAEETVGLQVTAQVTSITDDFAGSGYVALKLSRRLGEMPLYVALQGDHLLNWGDSALVDPSAKLALSWFGGVSTASDSYPVMVTLGAGTKIRNLGQDPGLFAGVGVGLTESLGVSAAFSGDYFDIGAGLRLSDRLSVVGAVNDVFDQKDRRRLTVSVNYSFSNLFGG